MQHATLSAILCSFLLITHAMCTPTPIVLSSRRGLTSGSARRALALSNVPLVDFFHGTDLVWSGNIHVGTPPQKISIAIDTGHTSLLFASILCGNACQQDKFDPSRSSTFQFVGNTTQIQHIPKGSGVWGIHPVNQDEFIYSLRNGKDTVSFGGYSVTNVNFELITNQTAAFNEIPFGILGLGANGDGIFAALVSQGLPSLFSLYLTPHTVGGAELTLGGIDATKFYGNPVFASLPAKSGSIWQLEASGLFVNGKTTALLSSSRKIMLDSGISTAVFSKATTKAIYGLISPHIKPYTQEPGTYGMACNRFSSLPAVIDITFTSQSGNLFNLTIPSSELNVGPFSGNPSICQAFIIAVDLEGIEVLGGSLLKHFYTIWDVEGQRLGFALPKWK